MNGLLLFLIIVNAYILLVYMAARSGLLARYNIGLMGPALMIRTQRGKGIIEWIAKARGFFLYTGTMGIWLTLVVMLLLTLLLIVQVPTLFEIPEEQAPGAREILALPGINPLIPVSYGIVALILSIVIHEFAHGVLARAQKMKVKSLGMLYLIVPIGAFVEPDEEQLRASSRKERMRVYAAGPTSNLVTALICALLFSGAFVAAAEPVADGIGIRGVVADGPADQAGFEPGWIITHIGATRTTDYTLFQEALSDTVPGEEIDVQVAGKGTFRLCLASRADADNLSKLGPGFDFCTLYEEEGSAPLVDKSGDAGAGNGTDGGNDTNGNQTNGNQTHGNGTAGGTTDQGFLGVNPFFFSTTRLHDVLARPTQSLEAFVLYIALPFTGLTPIKAPLTDFFVVPWGDGAFAETSYWVTANIIYWVMWISLMLGLTNALPAVPLDGGFLFRDFVDSILVRLNRLRRPKPQSGLGDATLAGADAATDAGAAREGGGGLLSTPEGREQVTKRVSIFVSLMILALILLQFLAPRIAGLL